MTETSDNDTAGLRQDIAALREDMRKAEQRHMQMEQGASLAQAQLGSIASDMRLFPTLIQKLSALEKRLDTLEQASAHASHHLSQVSAGLSVVQSDLAQFRRTAPGRGNVSLSNGRLLARISLPEFFPYFDPFLIVNDDDRLIVPKLAIDGYYELGSSRFVCGNIALRDHVVDIGANFGYYTVLMGIRAGWQGKVVAFEPEPLMVELLRENVLSNWIDAWTRVEAVACSDAPGTMTLYTSRSRAANTTMATPDKMPGYAQEFTAFDVEAARVDDRLDYLEGRVDFMKIDIEGGEPLAIRGARQTIANNPQIKIMMEWSPGQLQAAGFDVADFAKELEATNLALHALAYDGTVAPLDFATLATAPYQNIVLKRAEA